MSVVNSGENGNRLGGDGRLVDLQLKSLRITSHYRIQKELKSHTHVLPEAFLRVSGCTAPITVWWAESFQTLTPHIVSQSELQTGTENSPMLYSEWWSGVKKIII